MPIIGKRNWRGQLLCCGGPENTICPCMKEYPNTNPEALSEEQQALWWAPIDHVAWANSPKFMGYAMVPVGQSLTPEQIEVIQKALKILWPDKRPKELMIQMSGVILPNEDEIDGDEAHPYSFLDLCSLADMVTRRKKKASWRPSALQAVTALAALCTLLPKQD